MAKKRSGGTPASSNDDRKKWKQIRMAFWSVVGLFFIMLGLLKLWMAIGITIEAFLSIYIFIAVAYLLGRNNMFFTIVNEGQAKGVTAFGRSHRCLLAFTSFRFRGELENGHWRKDSFWDVYKLKQLEKRPEATFAKDFLKWVLFVELGGLKWVGIWPFYQIYTYNFRWTSLRGHMPTSETGRDYKYEEPRSAVLDYILVRQETYLLDLSGIEDKEQLSVDIKLVWTNQVVNPFKALFRVRSWLETSSDRMLTYIRQLFADSTWRGFQTHQDLQDQLRIILDQIELMYGIKTIGLEITDLKPPDEFRQAAEKIRAAQADVAVAENKAIAAEHEAAAIRTLADAEAGRVTKVMGAAKALGDDGVAMKITEDLAKGGGHVVVAGSTARTLVADLLGKKGV